MAHARATLLDELDPLDTAVQVEWRYIGGCERVEAMGYHGHSFVTGEPTFIIRYTGTVMGHEGTFQRAAYASDLFIIGASALAEATR